MGKVSDYISLKEAFLIIGGSLLYSAAMNLLIVPLGMFSGGFLGIAQLIREVFARLGMEASGVDIAGILYFLFNIPLFALSLMEFGKPFLAKTVLAVICYTIFLTVIVSPDIPVLVDRLTGCLFGGILAGIGAGMTLLSGGSGGGEEILGVYLSRRHPNFSVGKLCILINLFVYGSCLFLFDIQAVIYSLMVSFFTNFSLDKIHFQNIMMDVTIISKVDGMEHVVMEVTKRGVTCWDGRGGYTKEGAHILLTVVSKKEAKELKSAVRRADPSAFMIINEDVAVSGNFEMRV